MGGKRRGKGVGPMLPTVLVCLKHFFLHCFFIVMIMMMFIPGSHDSAEVSGINQLQLPQ